ncbi:FYVE zinc finger-domain-containing protein [Lipomyces kononenkoae]|uniref:FYVE zinc finger-domain-containing protein n=1 Tax=Lipomyces kononenkoae TaxID=34357 RepID=A0ACC3STK7_LIPKO
MPPVADRPAAVEVIIPPWQADSDVLSCPICQHSFTLFYRRHHCRICGRVVCGQCSSSYIPYPPGTYVLAPYQRYAEPAGTLLRTCDDCIREPESASAPESSYSSFPSADTVSRALQFPSILYNQSRNVQASPPSSLFSKGAVLSTSTSSVGHFLPSSPASSDFVPRRTATTSSRRLHSRHRLSQSSLSQSPTQRTESTIVTPISSSASSSNAAPLAQGSRSDVKSAANRLTSAFRFVGYGGNRSSSDQGLAPSASTDGSKVSTVESTLPINTPLQMSAHGRAGFRLVRREEPELDEDDEDTCPICSFKLFKLKTEEEREAHVSNCITNATFNGSPEQQKRRNRMVVYKLPESQLGKECVICFEEFEKNDLVARLECLCVYHRKCIKAWFDKKGAGECPIHAVPT